jgi:hypothetical protein
MITGRLQPLLPKALGLFVFLLLSLVPAALHAQVGTDGSILGIIKDSSGAVIPGAEITVTNLETNLTQTVLSNQEGYFQIMALPRGFYSVAVSLPGFKTWKIERTELIAGEQKRVSPILEVGEVSQQVSVEAGAELVQTERASIESVIEQKQIRDLPLNGRSPIDLVRLAPGMRFLGIGGIAREHTVQGLGQRDDATEFTVDGINANDPSNEKGMAFPNLDTVAEFSVETSNFSAEHGRNPVQVMLVSKSGANQFHGTLWEFHQDTALNARNAFSHAKPKLIQNQFGFTLGGPILKSNTFFFGSLEGTLLTSEMIYNTPVASDKMLNGDFSALSKKITDPLTGAQFPGNIIPQERFSAASKFFFPNLLRSNAPDGLFHGVAPAPDDLYNGSLRIDRNLTSNQRAYIRWVTIHENQDNPGYRPEVFQNQTISQHNLGVNYNWTLSPATLLTVSTGFLYSDTHNASNVTGKENFTQKAGIQGFPTEGRAEAVGLPNVSITGYSGLGVANNTPGRFRREIIDSKATMNLVRGAHSVSFGYNFDDRRTLAAHSSASARGTFSFNSQYTTDGFADYLLGLVQMVERNFPLEDFGMAHSPYSALYVQDYWRVHPNITLGLGARLDYWHEKAFVRGSGATFDLKRGKIIAGENSKGQVDLTSQPTAPFLAKSVESLVISATEAGVPHGLFEHEGWISPRLGVAWRPFGGTDLVVRGGYGIFTTMYNGNITGSQIIGPPFWTQERQTLTRSNRTPWETIWPQDPKLFISPAVTAAAFDVKPEKIHEWNLSIQKAFPFLKSALTISYVGNQGHDLITRLDHNEVPPGNYTNLQAARPYPILGNVRLYENIGTSWYNALHLRWDRRFNQGLGYTVSYAFSRNLDENGASITDFPTPFAPKGYDRGRSQLERRHILSVNTIWEVPVGRGRAFANSLHPVLNGILGGWQLSGIYHFTSGDPLTFVVPGTTLGNGFGTRPNLVGDIHLSDPSRALWFNPAALQAPPPITFGNSGQGLLDGPASHLIDTGLMKNFNFTETKYVQFRWEMFNAPNRVNLNDPVLTIGLSTTGKILSSGNARRMQFGMKFVF